MSYTFLQEQGEESSADSFSAIAPFVRSRLNLTAGECCCSGSGTECYHGSRSGTMCEPLMVGHGEESPMSCAEGSRAKISVQQGKGQGSMESGPGFGGRWLELSVRWDRNTSSWKTHQCLWEEDLDWSLVTWPRWGMMRDGVLWERITPGLLISATGSGFWQTPVADDAVNRTTGKVNSRGEPKLSAQVKLWPTPTVHGNYNRKGSSAQAGDGLATAVKLWPTPLASDGVKGGPNQKGGKGDLRLSSAVHKWPTPTASMMTEQDMIQASVHSSKRQPYEKGGGSLNPMWVEWLMGWPLAWTDSKPLETAKFQQWQRSHGDASLSFDSGEAGDA